VFILGIEAAAQATEARELAAPAATKNASRGVMIGGPESVDGLAGATAGTVLANATGGNGAGDAPLGAVVARPASAEGLSGPGVDAGHSLSSTPPATVRYERISATAGTPVAPAGPAAQELASQMLAPPVIGPTE
jgi:hypothetical protein